MSKRGRPRKRHSLFTVKNFIEYTSDSDSDNNNVKNNVSYEIASTQTLRRPRSKLPTQQSYELPPQQTYELPARPGSELPAFSDEEQNSEDHDEPNLHDQYPNTEDELLSLDANQEQLPREQSQLPNPLEPQEEQPVDQHEEQPPLPNPVDQHDEQRPLQNPVEHDFLSDIFQDSSNGEEEEENYNDIFQKLKSEWLFTEVHHCVSKTASEAFWKVAAEFFPKLSDPTQKKKPMFKTIRKKMYLDLLPKIDMQIGYKNKATGEVVIVKDTVTPVKRFSPSQYEKIFEIASVEVRN